MTDEKKVEVVECNLSKKLSIDQIEATDHGFYVKDHPTHKQPTKGKRIFVRVDFNVPIKDGKVTDTTRITATLPTLQKLISYDPTRIVICSHLGRPEGKVMPEYSLKPIVPILEKLLNTKIIFYENWKKSSQELNDEFDKLPKNSIILLENVRFYLEEEGKGTDDKGNTVKADKAQIEAFSGLIASMCDLYVNDAFGCSHRAHASIVGCEKIVKLRAAGLLVKAELKYFEKAISNPERPYLAILGGAKVADKIKVIESLLDRVDEMIICGGMAFTFLKTVNNVKIGKSIFDKEGSKIVQKLVEKAQAKKVKLFFPVDFVCAKEIKAGTKTQIATKDQGIEDDWQGLDIGPESIKIFSEVILGAKTVIWNGPAGVFEIDDFAEGTKAVLEQMATATQLGTITIIGGGDSAAACTKFGYESKVCHVSTGGGASLELLEGKVLPGVAALTDL